MTGHNEVVLVVYDPKKVSYETLLKAFFEAHDPTQGMRQGSDLGTLYRSGIYPRDAGQNRVTLASRDAYQAALHGAGLGAITTEIVPEAPFYFAEADHQQDLARNRSGGAGLTGTGVVFPDSARA
jgi:peptide-methionine (S)-S-oxide reductase